MIRILVKNVENKYYFPKNFKPNATEFSLQLKNTLTNEEKGWNNLTDEEDYADYFVFSLNFSGYTDGEYVYTIKDGEKEASTGLLAIGLMADIRTEHTKQYECDNKIKEYNIYG